MTNASTHSERDEKLLRKSPTSNLSFSAQWLRDSEEVVVFHEFSLPPTWNTLASEKVNNKSKRVRTGILVLREAIGSNTNTDAKAKLTIFFCFVFLWVKATLTS